ncbi:MAG: hypothetical protein B6229_00975 [Spirochaetaceae bacterium 4572_7]|nr:MAG: hypothetical protein B6229_00975 [Spirochaetaceae bacterium 4572_7]
MSFIIDDLSFSYGHKLILNSINAEFTPGEVSIIAGPNGSGKTTMIRVIMGLLNQKKKSVFIDGKDIQSIPILERAKKIGYVAQHTDHDFDFTVLEVVNMGRYPYKKDWNPKRDLQASYKAMELTDTITFKNRSITTLSGGELQRVLLARALAVEPKYLVLDEPSSNLDISHNNEMMRLIKNITRNLNITTVMVLHDLNSILHFADKVLMLKNGELLLSGSVHNILTPKNIMDIYGVKSQIITDTNENKHIVTL